jgi:sugar lactone lactonase YvrE
MTEDIEVINDKAEFPEGPVLYNNKLYYVEYAGNTVMTWDGKTNSVFWKQDGIGPSAVIPTDGGEFLVTGYDSNTIIKISAEGKTVEIYD